MCAIRSPAYTEPRPTTAVLRIRNNALDILHVGTRAVYGLTNAHEGILAEVFRTRNCYKSKHWKGKCRHDTGDGEHLRLSACIAHCCWPLDGCCCCGCPNIPLKNWNWAVVSANRENARIKRESFEESDMLVSFNERQFEDTSIISRDS